MYFYLFFCFISLSSISYCQFNDTETDLVLEQNGIIFNLPNNVILYEDTTAVKAIGAMIKLNNQEEPLEVVLDRGSGYQFIITIDNITILPRFKEVNRNVSNDNKYRNSLTGEQLDLFDNVTSKYCRYPIPTSYTLQKTKVVRSQSTAF